MDHGFAEQAVDRLQVRAEPIEFTESLLHAKPLFQRQRLRRQPGAALATKEIGRRTPRDQIRVQHRVHFILEPHPLAHDLRPAGHLSTQGVRRLVRDPHFG